jgi:diadenosine tetraphosphate (Ap4A) HIT family hydrolase
MSAAPTFAPPAGAHAGCELCMNAGGVLLWGTGNWRVVRVEDQSFPAFYRVICMQHVAELSDLPGIERSRCMDLVCAVERVLVERLRPTKVNLAALGNMVPHLHWHIVARFGWDSHFPQPIWGQAQREVTPAALQRLPVSLAELDAAVQAGLTAL